MSDEIKIMPGALSKLLELQGVTYQGQSGILSKDLNEIFNKNEEGVIAQDDKLVIAILVESVKHLNDKLEILKDNFDKLSKLNQN